MRWQIDIADVPKNAEYPVEAFQIGDGGVKRGPFYLKVEDLITALQQTPDNVFDADSLKGEEYATPPLPFGTIRYSKNESGSRQRVTMLLDKKMWEVRYGDEKEIFSIGFPRMIVQYVVVSSNVKALKITEMRIYAVLDDKKPITNETPLFLFPFPNVNKGNGIVCWGQNERLELNTLVELERAFRWFVSAPFNEDLGVRVKLGDYRFRVLLEKIKEQTFNDDWLVPAKLNFGDLFKN
jgi:hypothetical protein